METKMETKMELPEMTAADFAAVKRMDILLAAIEAAISAEVEATATAEAKAAALSVKKFYGLT